MTLEQYIDCLFDEFDFIELRLLPEKNTAANQQAKSRIFSKAEFLNYVRSGELNRIVETTLLYPCIGVNPRLATNRKELLAIKNMFIDYDNCEPPKIALENANIICRRGNNWHLYFCFKELPNTKDVRALYTKYARDLSQLTGSDINATDATRVVRIPFFPYRKNGVNEQGYVIEKIDTVRRDFDDTLGFVVLLKNKALSGSELGASKSFQEISTGVMRAGLDEIKTEFVVESRAEKIMNDAKERIEKFLLHYYAKKPVVEKGKGRSKFLYIFGCDCHGWGIEYPRALELAKIVNREKCLPPEDEKVVEHQIKCAYKYRKAKFGNYVEAFGSASTDHEIRKATEKISLINRIAELFSDWVYCHEAERFINTKTGLTYTNKSQSELYVSQCLGRKVSWDFIIVHGAIRTVEKIDYRPDCDTFFVENDTEYYNTYRKPKSLPREIDKKFAIDIFLEHLRYLTNNDTEFAWLLAWIAYCVKNVGKKIMWAPLIISQHTGVGKSALIELLKTIFGKWNVSEVSSYDLAAQHTDFMAEKVLVASHEVELAEKEAMHRLKNLITEEKVRIIQKYARTYEATNCANFIFLSNRPDALKIDEEDRRLLVIFNRKPPREQDYYHKLFKAIRKGAGHIYDYLCTLPLKGFDPYRRPPVTEGKELLISNSESDLSVYLRDLEENRKSVFAEDFFQTYELYTYIINTTGSKSNIAKYCSMRALQLWLSKNGYNNYVIQFKDGDRWKKRCYWSKKLTKVEIEYALNERNKEARHDVK